jgi:hypothetical protein
MSEETYANIEKLGKYKILAEIGRGGMARVFKAEDTESGRIVAVKALLPELASQPAFVKRFMREIETLRVLEHPRIVTILDVGEQGMAHYYVMEFMDGATIDRQFRYGEKMSVPDALRIARAVAEALQYAHAKGVIHRDIKPANIMTTSTGEIKLADFGIAKDIEATRLTVTGGIVGTADYMSPEQAEGRRVTRKSDVYSLGVCLYQMLTGRLPFVGKTYMDVIRAHRFTLPESPKTLNPSLPMKVARLVEMMMEKDPEKRLSSAGDVLALIDAIETTGHGLTDEERESAREMVRLALVADYDWRKVAGKIALLVMIGVLGVLAALGLKYRYFTSADYKFSLAMTEFTQGNYERAKRYFEDVRRFHAQSDKAATARECIEDCLRMIREKNKSAVTEKKKGLSGQRQYEYAMDLEARGDRKGAIALFSRLATDFPGTQWGRLAAQQMARLGAAQTVGGDGTQDVPGSAVERQPGQTASEL